MAFTSSVMRVRAAISYLRSRAHSAIASPDVSLRFPAAPAVETVSIAKRISEECVF